MRRYGNGDDGESTLERRKRESLGERVGGGGNGGGLNFWFARMR
jgi:hypothetical protein